jgi:hypothetical protein
MGGAECRLERRLCVIEENKTPSMETKDQTLALIRDSNDPFGVSSVIFRVPVYRR